jgi:hypothetical protein
MWRSSILSSKVRAFVLKKVTLLLKALMDGSFHVYSGSFAGRTQMELR